MHVRVGVSPPISCSYRTANQFDCEGIIEIAAALENNTRLIELNLSGMNSDRARARTILFQANIISLPQPAARVRIKSQAIRLARPDLLKLRPFWRAIAR